MVRTKQGPTIKLLHRMKLHVKTGDTVRILAGKDRDKTGKILAVDREHTRVVVEGVNVHKRFRKGPTRGQGEIVELPLAIHASNVMLVCPQCGATTRTKAGMVEDKKVRMCRKCEAAV